MSGVLRDLAFKHEPTWAVAWQGELLPIRFATEGEAALHLYGMETGHVVPAPFASTEYAVAMARRRLTEPCTPSNAAVSRGREDAA